MSIVNRVYEATEYDEFFYEDVEAHPKLRQKIERFQSRAKELGGEENRFPQEMFARLHSGALLRDKVNAQPWEPKVHQAVSSDSSFASLENSFLNDPVMSGLVAATFAESLAKTLEVFFETPDEDKKDQKEALEWQQSSVMASAVEAISEVSEVNDLMQSIGIVPQDGEDNNQARTDFALFLLNNEKAKEAIRNAGRLYRANNRAKRQCEGCTEVVGIECGSDLSLILPSELMLLQSSRARSAKIIEILEGKTLQYKLKSNESKERGPIVLLRDVSGSMNSYGRSMKAAAISMYTMKEANKSNREIAILPFCTSPLTNKMVLKKSSETIQPKQFENVLRQPNGGSTKISLAIIEACKMLGENEDADLVIVTDGICKITPEARNSILHCKELGARLVVVGVGVDETFSVDLKDLADEIVHCSDSSDFVQKCSGMKV